ncbi:MAG: PQQ-binding-like beta-propeller repeat protein [Planctomycetaceae bacterium]|nr:PQQ-binding-like beta-propeller repeat protein [Planctomycetaceae bacterium]
MLQTLSFSCRLGFAAALMAATPLWTWSADWRQFRGNLATGVAAATDVAKAADLEVAWSVPLVGRGLSSPIIVGDRVFVTSCSGYRQDRLHVACFQAGDGRQLWERQFWATGRTMSHPKTCNAAPSPACDGERIFAMFSSDDLICLDLDGNLQWYRGLMVDFPNASNSLGMAQSPLVVAGTLVVQIENDSQSLAVGVDPETGVSRWTSERPKRANWTSPAVLPGPTPQDDLILLQSSAGLAGVRPATGEVVWNYDNGASTIPSSTVDGGRIFVPSNGITALQVSAGSANPEVLWNEGKLGPGTASPIVVDGQLLVLNRAGVLLCAKTDNGETLWQKRLEGPFSASPVAAAGHLFFFSENGLAQVVKLGAEGEILKTKDLGQTILSTPAIAGKAVYVRSDQTLWKIGG